MALTQVIGKGLGTLGDGTANDTKIVFDGNAQDFHIGLDDSADSLTIGLGSTLGTTSHMVFDANGIITKPLQPSFSVTKSAQANFAVGSEVTLVYNSERFDQNADFASNTFTAPVTGRYLFGCRARVDNLDKDASYYYLQLTTSNENYYNIITFSSQSSNQVYYHFDLNQLADMDAGDTAYMKIVQPDGTVETDLSGDGGSQGFWGFLVC